MVARPQLRRAPSGLLIPLNGATLNYSTDIVLLGARDANNYVRQSWPSACQAVVQNDSIIDLPIDTLIILVQAGVGSLSIVEGSDVTVNIPPSLSLTFIEQFCQVSLRKVGPNEWDAIGGLA